MNGLRELGLFWIYSIERLNKKTLNNGWGLFQGQTTLGVMIMWLQVDILNIFANIRGNSDMFFNHEAAFVVGIFIISIFILDGLIYNKKRYQQACARFESLGKQEKRKYVVALWLCIFAFIGLTATAFATNPRPPHPHAPASVLR